MDIRSRADQIRRETKTQELIAEVRPYTIYKQSMDKWNADRAAAELGQNDITLCLVVGLVRSLTSRMDAEARKHTPDHFTRRSISRHVDELQEAVNDLRRINALEFQEAAE
jgi:hypothetical protein